MNRNNHDSARDPISLFAGVVSGSLLGILSPNLAPFEFGAFIGQLHIGERQVGVLVTTELMTVSVVALVSAPIFTRASCATFAIVGLVTSVVGQGVTMYAFDFPTMMMARSIAGVGLGMAYAAANAAGAGSRDPDRLFSFSTAASLAIIALLLPILAAVNGRHGLRGMYATVAMLSLLTLPALKGLGAGNARRRLPVEASTVAPARIGFLLAVLAIFNLGAGAVWSFFERIGVRHGMSVDAIAWLAGMSACVGIVGALLVSWVAPRFNRTVPLSLGLGIAAASFYLVPSAESTGIFIAGSIMYWVSYMFIYPYLLAIAAAFDPAGRCAAAAAGTLMTSYSLGPFAASVLASGASLRTLGLFGLICGSLAMLTLLPLTLALDQENPS